MVKSGLSKTLDYMMLDNLEYTISNTLLTMLPCFQHIQQWFLTLFVVLSPTSSIHVLIKSLAVGRIYYAFVQSAQGITCTKPLCLKNKTNKQ